MVPSFQVQKGAQNYKIEVSGQYWVVNGQNYLKINLEFFCSRIFPHRPHILQSPGTMTQMYGNKQQSVSQASEKPKNGKKWPLWSPIDSPLTGKGWAKRMRVGGVWDMQVLGLSTRVSAAGRQARSKGKSTWDGRAPEQNWSQAAPLTAPNKPTKSFLF